MSNVLIEAVDLRKTFVKGNQKIDVLRGINLSILEGEMVAITGASGAGKSTVLHILGTLEPATSGKVFFHTPSKTGGASTDRLDLSQLNDRQLSFFRNRTLGFIFQFHYLLPEFNALENIMMPALIAGHERSACEKQARDLLEFVGLTHRMNHRPTEMSGGEQQRVAIARAVILRPKLLLADELTGNLDSVNRDHILELLMKLSELTKISVVLVTHDMTLARKMHRTISMKDGQIVNSN